MTPTPPSPPRSETAETTTAAASGPSLLPCPFCGGKAGYECVGSDPHATWSIGCMATDADCIEYQILAHFSRKKEAAEAWNKRAPSLSQSLPSQKQTVSGEGTFEWAFAKLRDGKRVRRKDWAVVIEYTRTTPPLNYTRTWHLWLASDFKTPKVLAQDYWTGGIINGWGGSIGGAADDNPVRDGGVYSPSNEDKAALDWEVYEVKL